MNIPKESILTELEYFGFQNVQLDSIDQEKANKQALEHVTATQKGFGETLAVLHYKLKKNQIEWMTTKVASMVYDAQLRKKTSVTIFESDAPYQEYPLSLIGKYADRFRSALNVRLSEHGLCALDLDTISKVNREHKTEKGVRITFQMDAAAR
jgi:hypothetical protein